MISLKNSFWLLYALKISLWFCLFLKQLNKVIFVLSEKFIPYRSGLSFAVFHWHEWPSLKRDEGSKASTSLTQERPKVALKQNAYIHHFSLREGVILLSSGKLQNSIKWGDSFLAKMTRLPKTSVFENKTAKIQEGFYTIQDWVLRFSTVTKYQIMGAGKSKRLSHGSKWNLKQMRLQVALWQNACLNFPPLSSHEGVIFISKENLKISAGEVCFGFL